MTAPTRSPGPNADRLTGRGSDIFGYDALDRLTSSTVATTARTYAYSGDGLLQSRTQGTATSFLWDAATSPSRLLAQGGDRVIYGLGPLYIIKADGTTRALARDGGKSVRAEVDGTSAATGSWRYRAYGEINQTSGQATPSILGYAGQLLDPSDLYYMRARWYEPASGRFMSRDGFPGALMTPASLNAFAYAHANPSSYRDPSGRCAPPVTIVCILGPVIAPGPSAAAVLWVASIFGFAVVGTTAVMLATPETSPRDENPPAKDLKDARTGDRANEIATELGFEDADDLKDQIDAGATDIITVNKKTGDVWVRRAGSKGPGEWIGIIEP